MTYGTAEVNNGIYTVTLNASSSNGDDHGSVTFEWDVNDTNRLGWMDDQISPFYVTGSVHAIDAFGHAITYGAVGLPPGKQIDAQTGSLTGGQPIAQITNFSVTISATDGVYTDYRNFHWTILGGNTPAIFMAINDTNNSADDLLVLNSPSPVNMRVILYDPLHANTPQSVVIKALDRNGLLSDKVTLGNNNLSLADGGTAEVSVTPTRESDAENDIHFVAFLNGVAIKEVDDSVISLHTSVVVPLPASPDPTDHIRAQNTPTGMADRIPPRTPTPYIVWYTMGANGNKITDMEKYFWIRVPANPNQEDGKNGMSWKNGYIVLKDAAGKEKSWDKFVPAANPNGYTAGILGWVGALPGTKKVITAQTQPGNAGKLFFTLFDAGAQDDNGKKEYESKGFSVAAIPIAIEMRLLGKLEGKNVTPPNNANLWLFWGANYKVVTVSDSGPGFLADLDQILMSEWIVPQTKRDSVGGFESPIRPANDPHRDRMGLAIPPIQKKARNGEINTEADVRAVYVPVLRGGIDDGVIKDNIRSQHFVFFDLRTSPTTIDPKTAKKADAYNVSNSGFKVTYVFTKYAVAVTKIPYTDAVETGGAKEGIMGMADQVTVKDDIK